ncbi:unnamed protein product [Adineta ricciae]|uniref:DNA-directed primase/polymerase protein n=1 Tax=Adineta ricciae TaxID=249248 RepID=A0A814ILK3_ADIRI|nr:unnamed protein product [Adineta ricciae]
MSVQNEKSWKNRLQEYCQKNKLPMPNYRVVQPTSGTSFQADVEINGQWYRGDNDFTSKRNAEQAAAKTAYNSLSNDDMELQSGNIHIGQHMPERYAHIEQCISDMVMAHGGRIRKIHPPNSNGIYKIEITGKYRYCENVQRHHRINRVYLLVDPVNNIYYQKCYDPDCHNFRSAAQSLPIR